MFGYNHFDTSSKLVISKISYGAAVLSQISKKFNEGVEKIIFRGLKCLFNIKGPVWKDTLFKATGIKKLADIAHSRI